MNMPAAILKTGNTPNVHSWLHVPQSARLVISLTGTGQNALVIGSGTVHSDNSPPGGFHDPDVQPGPVVVQLVGQDACSVVMTVIFGTDATADVAAFVEDTPGGTRSPVDYHETFKRTKGSAETILFTVVTV